MQKCQGLTGVKLGIPSLLCNHNIIISERKTAKVKKELNKETLYRNMFKSDDTKKVKPPLIYSLSDPLSGSNQAKYYEHNGQRCTGKEFLLGNIGR